MHTFENADPIATRLLAELANNYRIYKANMTPDTRFTLDRCCSDMSFMRDVMAYISKEFLDGNKQPSKI